MDSRLRVCVDVNSCPLLKHIEKIEPLLQFSRVFLFKFFLNDSYIFFLLTSQRLIDSTSAFFFLLPVYKPTLNSQTNYYFQFSIVHEYIPLFFNHSFLLFSRLSVDRIFFLNRKQNQKIQLKHLLFISTITPTIILILFIVIFTIIRAINSN